MVIRDRLGSPEWKHWDGDKCAGCLLGSDLEILMHGERERSGTGQREKLDHDRVAIKDYSICTKRRRNIPFLWNLNWIL